METEEPLDYLFYEGEILFAPLQKEVVISIGLVEELASEHIAFFSSVEERYDSWKPEAKRLFVEYRQVWEPEYEVPDFDEEFELEALVIPPTADPTEEWSMTFTC
ncbi:hypothetical protein [Fibrella forsythiae]|uniref:Uncharacterized protein n=1 Tax=Fibrella forsythiae TaxID=2817061 RepID=A0ABS3JKZ7_9BACT|nr:hypothetical protein [Fibrella forsythiae]MBO0950676.1 hypothetical protein [Fibrella forsythiae]